jgi:L-ascorbate metabolism protein UlaG (beta-lactamase superfamily)
MEARLLGWAGVQLRDGASSLVVDPLEDAGAVWAAAGELARRVPLPPVVPAEPAGSAAAGLVTHLHRDHADAAALQAALAPGAPVLVPEPYGGGDVEEAAVAQAAAELDAAGLDVRTVRPWESVEVDGWTCTATPAADGTGDPQVSWLVARDGAAVFHGGDTLPHGWWWRIAERAGRRIDVAFLPINGARVAFPHRRPASPRPVVMDGTDAAVAGALLRAGRVVPIHYDAYTFPPVYEPDPDALGTLRAAAAEHGVVVDTPARGAWFEVAAA